MYEIVYTKEAVNNISNLKEQNLDLKVKKLINLIKESPFQNPPPYEKLIGNLKGLYSRRINSKHRLVYEVFEKENVIKIISMWSHYEF